MVNLELNIFRLKDESNVEDVISKIEQNCENKYANRKFEKKIYIDKKEYDLKFFFYLTENQNANINWYDEISSLFDSREVITKSVYSSYGILLIYCEKFKYVILFGRATFVLSEYINWNFGLEMAEKMLNKSSINAQSSKYYSTSKNKSLIVYNKGRFNAEAGESVDLINADISEVEGKSSISNLCYYINSSVGFSSGIKIIMSMKDIVLKDIVNVIILINKVYKEYNARFNIPKLLFIKPNDEIVNILNEKLNNDIMEVENLNVSISIYSIIDSDLILTNNITKYKLTYNRQSKEYNVFNIADIRDFMIENEIKNVEDINLRIFFDEKPKYINILQIIDYTTEIEGKSGFFCLYDGKWAKFNSDYIKTINEKIGEINNDIVTFDNTYDLSKQELEIIKRTDKKEICEKLNIQINQDLDDKLYREYVYNYKISKELNAKLLDRKKFNNIEICDIYHNDELIHTKIGAPGNFNECINQSLYGFEMWNNKKEEIRDELDINDVNAVTLLLITSNKSVLRDRNINKFKSVRFKLNLIDWKSQIELYKKNAKIIIAELKD